MKVGKERLWIWFLILKSILKTPRGSGQIYLSGSTCPWPSDNTYRLPQIVRSVTGMEIWEQEHLSIYVTREVYLSYHLLTTIDIRLALGFEKTQISVPTYLQRRRTIKSTSTRSSNFLPLVWIGRVACLIMFGKNSHLSSYPPGENWQFALFNPHSP